MQSKNDVRKVAVQCECGGKETVGSLMSKIIEGAAELERLINSGPMFWTTLYHSHPHAACEGKGFINVADGPEDFQQVKCEGCNGTGQVVTDN